MSRAGRLSTLASCAASLLLALTAACMAGPAPTTDPAPTVPTARPEPAGAAKPARRSAPKTTPRPKPNATPADIVAPEPTEATLRPAPMAPGATATPQLRATGSRVEEQVFTTPALGREMTYLIYLPAGYDGSARRYPTLYLLHGVAGDSTEWPSIGVPDAADRLIAAGVIQPMLIVFPNADASYYVNNATRGTRWSDYLVEDVVADVDARFRSLPGPESRAVGGLSMGGDGALQLAIRFPEVFGVAGAHSPSSRLLFEHAAADVYGTEQFFRAHNPFWLAQHAPGVHGLTLWIDVGDEDPWRWNASAIHFALEARGVVHEFALLPGIHDADYWIANLDQYLDFYSRALVGP